MAEQTDPPTSDSKQHKDPGHTAGKAEGDEKTIDKALNNQPDKQQSQQNGK